jgi:S-formylglutathione hydrolase
VRIWPHAEPRRPASWLKRKATVNWKTIDLAGKPADIFSPAEPRGVVLFLHGYDGATLRDNSAYTAALLKRRLACVCPHGPRCWWTDAIYRPFDVRRAPLEYLREDVVEFIRREWGYAPPEIAVTGVEMGGQGALQLAYRHARQFPVVAAISPKVDFETWYGHGTTLDELFPDREAARQHTATLHVHPLDWPAHQLLLCDPADQYCLDGVLTLASKLSSTGIPCEQDFSSSHGGYGWDYANAMAGRVVEFLARGLEEVRRKRATKA